MNAIARKIGPVGLWGGAAVLALLIAILAGRSDAGAQRIAIVVSSLSLGASQSFHPGGAGQRPSETDIATRQLAEAVRGLTEDQDRLTTRLAAVEHNLDDMTGSIDRQIEAAKSAQAAPPWPDDQGPTSPAAIAAMLAPPNPTPGTMQALADEASPPMKGYGADIGGALSIKSLHTRWSALRAAAPQLFEGLRPGVSLRENSHSKKTELRLVVGPFSNAEAAARLCIAMAALRVACQPTMFDGRLALQ
jgi:hypothetical protein